jgi:outer membrane protein OmpA-like peptidoglycan-associated protein
MRLVLLLVFFLPIYISAQDTVSTAPKKDIFFIFDLYVKDKETGKTIPNCEVTLIGSDGSQVIKTTDSTGKVSFDKNGEERYIKKETSYNFQVFKKDYLSAKGKFSTIGEKTSKRYVEEIYVLERTICGRHDFPDIQFTQKSSKLLIEPKIYNPTDSLDFLHQTLIDNPNIIIEFQGHSDCTEKDFDKKLSQKRAQACVDYLVSKGIPKDRLVAQGYGDEIPRIYNLDCESISKLPTKEEQEKAHQMNRRVQFIALSYDYKPTNK